MIFFFKENLFYFNCLLVIPFIVVIVFCLFWLYWCLIVLSFSIFYLSAASFGNNFTESGSYVSFFSFLKFN